MEGIKRLRLIPSYFFHFSFKSEDAELAKDVVILRCPENFESLTEKVCQAFNLVTFSMASIVKGNDFLVTNEKTYQILIQSTSEKFINLSISTTSQHLSRPRSKKLLKPLKVSPFSLIFSKSASLRTIKFTNILTRQSKIIKNELFSMTSRSISQGHKIYLIGGRKNPRQVLIVDAVSWEVSNGPELNCGRYWCSLTVFQGKIAVIGGVQGEKLQKTALVQVEVLKNNIWTYQPALNLPRGDATSAYFNETVFVFCGTFYQNGKIRAQESLERWNGTTWDLLQLKYPFIFNPGLFALSPKSLLIIGGTSADDEELASVLVYDVETGLLVKKDSLQKKDYFTSGQLCRVSSTLYLEGSLHGLTRISLDL